MLYLLLIFLLILILVDIIKNKKLLTPGLVFNLIFFVTLFLYSFKLSFIQQTLSNRTILILFLSVVAYNLPIFIYYFARKKKQNNFTSKQPLAINNFKSSKLTEFIAFLVVIIIFAVELINAKGCPFIWKFIGTDKVYVDYGIPYLHAVFNSLVIFMGGYSLFQKKNYYKYFYIMIPILIISRQVLISMVLQGLIFFLLRIPKFKKRHILLLASIAVVGVTLFSVIGNFRTGESSFLTVAEFKPQYEWIPTSIKWIYSYMCFSLSNLNNLISMTDGFITKGVLCLNELLPSMWTITTDININFLVSPSFTVSTFAPTLYIDFGMFGIIGFCLILGLIAVFLYDLQECNLFIKFLYAIFLHNILLLFFVNFFLNQTLILEVLFVILIFLLQKTKKNDIIQSSDKNKQSTGGKL